VARRGISQTDPWFACPHPHGSRSLTINARVASTSIVVLCIMATLGARRSSLDRKLPLSVRFSVESSVGRIRRGGACPARTCSAALQGSKQVGLLSRCRIRAGSPHSQRRFVSTAMSFFLEERFTSDTSCGPRSTESLEKSDSRRRCGVWSASSRWQATGESSCSSLFILMGSDRAKVPKENCRSWPQDF